jgi:hypothetical protein
MMRYNRATSYIQADIDDFIKVSEERMIKLMQLSIQDVVNEAQQVGPSKGGAGKGGRMRVDTGFLRSSGQHSIGSIPSGPTRGEKKLPNSYDWDSGPLGVTLTKLKFGDVFFFGWTAGYAEVREVYDGFLDGALQNWARIVAFNTDTLRNRIKK